MRIEIHNPPPERTPVPQWMLSLTDLLSLILAFFVLIFATTNPTMNTSKYDKKYDTDISATTQQIDTNVGMEKTDQDASTGYLYKVMKDKIAEDKELSVIRFYARDEDLVLRVKEEDFAKLSIKLARLLKVIENNIWVYANNMDTAYDATQKLQKAGFDQDITFAQTSGSNGQIDILIRP